MRRVRSTQAPVHEGDDELGPIGQEGRLAPVIGFALDSLIITTSDGSDVESCSGNRHLLDRIASQLLDGSARVELSPGSPMETRVSFTRLEAVRIALIGRGISVDRITLGGTHPTSNGLNSAGPPGMPEGVRVTLKLVDQQS